MNERWLFSFCVLLFLITFLFLLFFCKVEELLLEMKETEEEVARWREACELEVEAGKNVVEERDKVVKVYGSL